MKPKKTDSARTALRCTHQDASGRQCRSLSFDQGSGLCPRHLAVQKQKEASNFYAVLARNSQGFQTAQGINYALSNLYELLSKNRISPRRAAVLAHISSLLLRTLPAIDADHAAGILDPTRPMPAAVDRVDDEGEGAEHQEKGNSPDYQEDHRENHHESNRENNEGVALPSAAPGPDPGPPRKPS